MYVAEIARADRSGDQEKAIELTIGLQQYVKQYKM